MNKNLNTIDQTKSLINKMYQAVKKYEEGDLSAANSLCEKILANTNTQPDALNLLAIIARQSKQLKKAEKIARFGVISNPSHSQIKNTLGLILMDLSKNIEAKDLFLQSHLEVPLKLDYISNFAKVSHNLGEWELSEEFYGKALKMDASFIPALVGIALVFIDLGQFSNAREELDKAFDIDPFNPSVSHGLGLLALACNQLNESYLHFDNVVKLSGGVSDAKVNRGLIRMLQGRLKAGWSDYNLRSRRRWNRSVEKFTEIPKWSGECLRGKSIVIWSEQGLGECILCSSLINTITDEAAVVFLECSSRLVEVFRRSFPKITIVSDGDDQDIKGQLDSPNFQSSIFDLLGYKGLDIVKNPISRSFLKVTERASKSLRVEYQKKEQGTPLVGLSFSSPQALTSRHKAFPLALMEPLLKMDGLRFVNLQYGKDRSKLTEFFKNADRDIIDDGNIDPSVSLSPLANQIGALDLVISVSNTTAHLSGAIGTPTWVIVPALGLGSMWYWLSDCQNCVWYPSVSLFRRSMGTDATLAKQLMSKLEKIAFK